MLQPILNVNTLTQLVVATINIDKSKDGRRSKKRERERGSTYPEVMSWYKIASFRCQHYVNYISAGWLCPSD